MNHSFSFMSCILVVLALSCCATVPREVLYPGATALLPGIEADMNTPGYWISHHADPDRVILDRSGIVRLNALIRDEKLVRDLDSLPPMTGKELKQTLASTAAWIGGLNVFQRDGKKVDRAFLSPLIEEMDYESIPEAISRQYCFLVSRTEMRVLPTHDSLCDGPGDSFIDNLQASSLDPGTPLVILHRSKDGAWLYAVSELVSGWVPCDSVAFASQDVFLARYHASARLVVTAGKADLYADEKLAHFLGCVHMGTLLVQANRPDDPSKETAKAGTETEGKVRILLANRDSEGYLRETSAWVEADQVSSEFLSYTPRTIYQQAFRLLNAPYGWGGSFGEQDCSQFLCEIFSTVGIKLPRNSRKQMLVGSPVPGFNAETPDAEKMKLLSVAALPGATILRFPGHIMLYLGTVNGKPYAIHSTLSYREKRGMKEISRLINRVVVSNLELGDRSSKGTHLHRLTTATVITLPPADSIDIVQTSSGN